EDGAALADAVIATIPAWVVRCVTHRAPHLHDEAAAAGARAVADVGPRLHELLSADIDEQRVNPLMLVRAAVRYPTQVLTDAGIEPPHRSSFDVEHFPDDPYDLVPMTWRDVDESLHELGIVWGARKAMAHRARHGGGSTS
ncbi:MAG: hypothetical protein V7636_891, partial [Actinomycetota bacterium]